jgi:hypothetical protein
VSLPNWVTTWIAIGALLIAVAGFILRWVEFRHSRQRKVTLQLSGDFVEENEIGDGFPVCNLQVFNAGAVTVRVRWWYLSNGKKKYFPGSKSPLVGAVIEPGDYAEDTVDYNYLSHTFANEDFEFRAYVMLIGERHVRRSNWFGLSSQAEPSAPTRRLRRTGPMIWRGAKKIAKRRARQKAGHS